MTPFHLVLVAPEIPQNTGTIGRLAVSTDAVLHLIDPLGFSLEDKYLKRAGLDYWQYLELHRYSCWEEFTAAAGGAARLLFFSTHGEKSCFDESYRPGDYLVFGRESSGLPPEFYDRYRDDLRVIPMPGAHSRSLNLANAVSIVLYEALRQTLYARPAAE